MISRRYIRVKVMQTLYVLETMDSDTIEQEQKQGIRILEEKLKRTFDLFTTCLLYTIRIAQYAETYAQQKANKYLPTHDDLNINTKIAQNTYMLELLANVSFLKRVKDGHLEHNIAEEWVKKSFQKLVGSNFFKEYILTEERNPKVEKAIFRHIWFDIIVQNEKMMEYFDDEMTGWEDDAEMMMNMMENFFHLSALPDFAQLMSDEKTKYAYKLLTTTIDKKDFCMELIKPKLLNWDADRVAIIDLILLCMGITELLYFETIPTKVTINEFIEVSKMYSTRQSGPFVNGVLDNIYKDLVRDNKINKIDPPVKKPQHEA